MTAGLPGRTLRLLGGLLALYLAIPLVAFLVRLVRSPNAGFSLPGLYPAMLVSAETATISATVIALFGLPLAYALARARRTRVANAIGLVASLPLALPPVMSGILLIYLVGPYSGIGRFFQGHLTESLAGVVLAQCFVAAPFLVAVARAAFSAVDPALFDLAATLGHRELGRFFRVALPAARAGISAGLLLAWLRAFGEYGATVILAYHPYSLPVFTDLQFSGVGLTGTEAPTALALGVAALVVLVVHTVTPRRRRERVVALPAMPTAAPMRETVRVAFALDFRLGTFALDLAHRASASSLAILGPSGSGKSATLRALAGLYGAAAGEVAFNDDAVTALPAEARRVGYVPQSGALFPGRNVWQQVAFSVAADPPLAAWWLERLEIADLAGRLPEQLSGGQRQRVHLARALACSPRLLLLDEPFSALDTPVRESLRYEFRRLQRERGLSSVLVTHDPVEAAMLAEELLVVEQGRVLQAGRREAVFAHPASATVARLLGIENVLAGRVEGSLLRSGNLEIALPAGAVQGAGEWCVPATQVRIGGTAGGVVVDLVDRGLEQFVLVDVGATAPLAALLGTGTALRVGSRVGVEIEADAVTWWATEIVAADLEKTHNRPGARSRAVR